MARYGQFTDYTEDPDRPGAYQFSTANGPPLTFSGPPAEELKSRVDAIKQAEAAGMLAKNDQPTFGDINAGNVPPEPGGPPRPPPTATDAGGAAEALPPPPPATELTPKQKADMESAKRASEESKARQEQMAAGVIKVPGHAGSKGGFMPTSETRQGGFDEDPNYVNSMMEANVDVRLARQKAYESQQQLNAATQGQLQADHEAQIHAENEARQQAAQLEKGVAEKEAEYNRARDTYKSTKIDTKREARDPLNVIGQLLGVLGAHFPGAKRDIPNYAQQIVSQKIRDDIAAQETELNVKRESANNALGDLQRQLGSRDLAKASLSQLMHEEAQNKIQQAGQTAKTADDEALYQEWGAKNSQEIATWNDTRRREAEGMVTRSLKYNPPVAASAGGYRPATMAEQKSAAELEHARLTNKALAEKTEAPAKISPRLKVAVAASETAESQLNNLEATFNAKGKEGASFTGYGDYTQDVKAQARAVAPLIAKATGGKVEDIAADLSSRSGEHMAQSINRYREAIVNQRKALLANPEAVGPEAGAGAEAEGAEAEGGGSE
jgi:hypothetical protein